MSMVNLVVGAAAGATANHFYRESKTSDVKHAADSREHFLMSAIKAWEDYDRGDISKLQLDIILSDMEMSLHGSPTVSAGPDFRSGTGDLTLYGIREGSTGFPYTVHLPNILTPVSVSISTKMSGVATNRDSFVKSAHNPDRSGVSGMISNVAKQTLEIWTPQGIGSQFAVILEVIGGVSALEDCRVWADYPGGRLVPYAVVPVGSNHVMLCPWRPHDGNIVYFSELLTNDTYSGKGSRSAVNSPSGQNGATIRISSLLARQISVRSAGVCANPLYEVLKSVLNVRNDTERNLLIRQPELAFLDSKTPGAVWFYMDEAFRFHRRDTIL